MIADATKHIAIIDWISVTCKGGKLAPSDLPTNGIEARKGLLGYSVRVDMPDGRIMLTNPSRQDMGTHIIYSGETLKNLREKYGQDDIGIVVFHNKQGHKITRMDIAVDIYDGFTAKECIQRYENSEAISTLRKANKIQGIKSKGDTLYVGRRGGDRMVRIYDKAAEQNQDGEWTRTEAELRGFAVEKAVNHLMETKSPEKAISAIIKGIVDFPDWKEWNETFENMTLDTRGQRKETNSTEHWLLTKVAPSIAKFAFEHEGWLDRFAEHVNQLIAEMEGKHSD